MIFIPGNVPSLKNSKVMTKRGIFSSKTVSNYIRSLGIQSFNSRKKTVKGYVDPNRPNELEAFREAFKKMREGKEDPIFIGYHQVRRTKTLFDFSNSIEVIQDLFTSMDFIEDDNVKYVFPVPMTVDGELPCKKTIRKKDFYSINKENPGVWVKIF